MGKYSGALICSDFDGTLYYQKRVSEANLEAIRYFQENGGRFTLATGRQYKFLETLPVGMVCNTHLICLNGAIIYDHQNQKILFEERIRKEETKDILSYISQNEKIKRVSVFSVTEVSAFDVLTKESEQLRRAFDQELYKIIIRVGDEDSEAIKAEITERFGKSFSISRSWINGIELNRKGCDKGHAARRLADMIGADRLICIGDYENDISMIRMADYGVAMGNGVEELKKEADFVTASVEEDGFAKMIESL